jgi:hypothetical protein
MTSQPRPLGDRKTAGYRPRVFGGYRSAVIDGKPRFLLSDVDRMLDDPQVQFCLRILRSPLFGVELEFAAATPEATAFGKAQLDRIWKRSISQFSRFLEYGYCAGELTFASENDRVVFDRFYDVHPLDAHPLLYKGGPNHGKVAAVRVRSSSGQNSGSGQFDLEAPNAFWFAGETRYGSLFGYPRTAGMYEPWLEKCGKNGAKQARQGWYFKNASRGGMMRYPDGNTDMGDLETGPRLISNQDLSRQILEQYKSGGVLTLPGDRDKANPADYAWIWEDPKTNADVAGLRDYPKDLDREILIGGGVPPELVEASTVGSGYSGRAIPAQVFFTSMDEVIALLLEAIDHQILKYLMRVNFGDVRYEVRAKSLAQAVQEDPAQAGKMLGGGEEQQQQPQPPGPPQRPRPNPSAQLGMPVAESLRDRVRRLAEMDYPDLESVELGWAGTTSRTGGIKAVGTGPDAGRKPLYGDAARSVLEGRGEKFKEANEGLTPKEKLQADKQKAEPKRQAARDVLAKLAENPSLSATIKPEDLVEHISQLTRDELREYARKMAEKVGGKKAELAKRIAEKSLGKKINRPEASGRFGEDSKILSSPTASLEDRQNAGGNIDTAVLDVLHRNGDLKFNEVFRSLYHTLKDARQEGASAKMIGVGVDSAIDKGKEVAAKLREVAARDGPYLDTPGGKVDLAVAAEVYEKELPKLGEEVRALVGTAPAKKSPAESPTMTLDEIGARHGLDPKETKSRLDKAGARSFRDGDKIRYRTSDVEKALGGAKPEAQAKPERPADAAKSGAGDNTPTASSSPKEGEKMSQGQSGGGGDPPEATAADKGDGGQRKEPWQMNFEEFRKFRHANGQKDEEVGLPNSMHELHHEIQIKEAFKRGENVPQEVADVYDGSHYLAEEKKFAAQNPGWRKRLEELSSPIPKLMPSILSKPVEVGKKVTVTAQQTREGFVGYEKGQFVQTPDGPRIVANAGKIQRTSHADYGTTGYHQEVTFREPKKTEMDGIDKAIKAKKAINMSLAPQFNWLRLTDEYRNKVKKKFELAKEALS